MHILRRGPQANGAHVAVQFSGVGEDEGALPGDQMPIGWDELTTRSPSSRRDDRLEGRNVVAKTRFLANDPLQVQSCPVAVRHWLQCPPCPQRSAGSRGGK